MDLTFQVLAINKGKTHSIQESRRFLFYYSIVIGLFRTKLKKLPKHVNIKLCMLHIERQYLTNLKVFSID
jgi:hypothetical protein